MDDDRIIRPRIAGHSVREIAKARRCSVSAINEAIDRWPVSVIDDKTRKNNVIPSSQGRGLPPAGPLPASAGR